MIKNIFIAKNRYFEVDCIGFYRICQIFWFSVLNSLTFYKISSNIQSIGFAISSFAEIKSVLFNSNLKLTAKFEKTIQKQSLKSLFIFLASFSYIFSCPCWMFIDYHCRLCASKSSLITNHFLTVKVFILIWNKEFFSLMKNLAKGIFIFCCFLSHFLNKIIIFCTKI